MMRLFGRAIGEEIVEENGRVYEKCLANKEMSFVGGANHEIGSVWGIEGWGNWVQPMLGHRRRRRRWKR